MLKFETEYKKWIQEQIKMEKNARRRDLLENLGHGSIAFLRNVWYPAVGNFDHLYPEWEVRDFNNGFRYIDFAYIPAGVKGGIEIQGYGSHARDLEPQRFIDLCERHCLLALEGWIFLPIAYLSIRDSPKKCQKLILSFIGKFLSSEVTSDLSWVEAETIRFARRLLRPISQLELADHLKVSDRHARRVLHGLVEKHFLCITSGNSRARTYGLISNN